MRSPTPADVARQLARPALSGADIAERFRSDFAALDLVCKQLGLDPSKELVQWSEAAGSADVADWLNVSLSGFEFAHLWSRSVANDRFPSLFESLIVEDHLSGRVRAVGPYARSHGAGIASMLAKARERVGNAAFHRALQMGASKKFVYARTLELAREYLQFSIDYAESRETKATTLRARMGMVTVLSARNGHVDLANLRRAVAELEMAYSLGYENALDYLLEALTLEHDVTRNIEPVLKARKLPSKPTPALADVWIRLAGAARNAHVRRNSADRAHALLGSASSSRSTVDDARLIMTRACATFIVEESTLGRYWDTYGLTFPFLMRNSARADEDTIDAIVPTMIDALGPRARQGEYLFRDLCAEMCSFAARRTADPIAKANWLRRAIGFRDGGFTQKPLRIESSRIAQSNDKLLLAAITGDSRSRREGLSILLEIHRTDQDDASALALIANDVEANGALNGALLPSGDDLALAIRNGLSDELFQSAALRALKSGNTQRTLIGGRGAVETVADVHGVTGATFVYKTMTALSYERDLARTERLSSDLLAAGRGEQFGVIEHLAHFPTPGDGNGIISVRRFMKGETLHEALLAVASVEKVELLTRASKFLAFAHSRPLAEETKPSGVRRELLGKEVGRWLRILDNDQHSRYFSRWWAAVVKLPVLQRRDAHAHNWIISDQNKVLAVDLDAIGWRPLGYELAQLIDDFPYLGIADPGRSIILDAYRKELETAGIDCTNEGLLEGVRAGQFARAIRALSDPVHSIERMNHAVAILDDLEKRDDGIGRLARDTSARWAVLAGRTAPGERRVSDATRHRISRAMSYHLRHDQAALVNRGGWMHVDDLVAALAAAGHRVSTPQVIAIAGAMGEPRFQCDGEEIRALYGHSTRVEIDYKATRPPEVLFHATPLDNMPSIVEAQDGLRRGNRNWVHLSSDPHIAMGAARRQGRPVALLAIQSAMVSGIVQAAPTTFLAPHVPLDAVAIVPLRKAGNLQGVSRHGLTD